MNKSKAKEISAKLAALDPASDGFDAEVRGLYEQAMGASAGPSIPSDRVYKSVREAVDEVLNPDAPAAPTTALAKPKRKPKEEPKGTRTYKVERKLPVTLTRDEIVKRADEIGNAVDHRTKLEAETLVLKTQIKSLSQKISVLDDEIAHLGDVLKTGREERSVEVAVTLDLKNNHYEEIRSDTGEVTVDRPLQGIERQGTLFDPNQQKEGNDEATATDGEGAGDDGEVSE